MDMDMENNQQQQKKNVPFPCDLVDEILLRLPVKSIVRFRSLSKQIQSRTSDPNFTKSNFDLCSSPPTIALLSIADRSVSAYSVDSGWVNLNKPIHHLKVRPSVASIIGSCRGFILLMLDEPNFLLWNPLTDAIKTMSYSPAPPSTRYLWHRDFCFGFGYDESIDDYLAVVVRKRSDADHFNVNQTNWTCFSVRNNSWRDIETKSDSVLSLESKFGVFCNGAIHWFGIKKHRLFQMPVIVALDLKEMRLSEIQIPIARQVDRALKVFEGCIALCLWHKESNKISIWEMKEYNKVCPNWTKRYVTIAFDNVSLYDPLYFNESGELVAIKNGKQLVKFDEEGRLVMEHEASDDDPKREIIMFPLSLLSLPGHSNNTSDRSRKFVSTNSLT